MTSIGFRPDHRNVEEQMPAPGRRFNQSQPLALHQARRAPEHGVGAFHRFESYAGPVGDGHALSQVEAGQRVGDFAAIFDVAEFIGVGFTFRIIPAGASRGFSSRVESTSSMPSSESTFPRRRSASRYSYASGGQEFNQAPVRADGGEDLRVFHLAGHHDLRHAFAIADLDQLAQFAEETQ